MRRYLALMCLLTLCLSSCSIEKSSHHTSDLLGPHSTENATTEENFVPKDFYDAALYTGLDVELTFWSQNCDTPYGLWGPAATLLNEKPEITREADTALEEPGVSITGQYETKSWENFEVKTFIACESAHTSEGFQTVYSLVTLRNDIYTYRGIHVGNTLEDLLVAYPDMGYDLDGWYQEYQDAGLSGQLRYTPEEYRGSLSPDLIFWIENDLVTKMELKYEPKRFEF